ncbi:hypothetical protein [Caballeronia ptereochthonis]|uniref:hypothetical protein n=1 Tax=Caballeronia ptereochthonis TaxID=1777144 RepID=UPI00142D47A4|nr:hypothetical protein [Caballeronia ptereochthonis]
MSDPARKIPDARWSRATRYPAPCGGQALRKKYKNRAPRWTGPASRSARRAAGASRARGPQHSTVYWVLQIAVFACIAAFRAAAQALSTQKGNALEYAVNFGAQTESTVSFFPVCFPGLFRRSSVVRAEPGKRELRAG